MGILTDPQRDEAALLYTEHEWTLAELAEHFDTSTTTIRKLLLARGIALRPSNEAAPELRMKQCTNCLHFLPAGMFSYSVKRGKKRLQSWCMPCTAHPKPEPWRTDTKPLADAIGTWRIQ